MALIYCHSCKKLVFDSDLNCPNCGERLTIPMYIKLGHFNLFGIIALGFFILSLVYPSSSICIIFGIILSLAGFFIDRIKWFSGVAIFFLIVSIFSIIVQKSDNRKQSEMKLSLADSLELVTQERINDSLDLNVKPFKDIRDITNTLVKTDFKKSNYYSAEDVLEVYNILREATLFADKYEMFENPKIAEEAKQLRKLCITKQKVAFPILRSAYANVLGQALWEDDIDVKYSGTTITFIGGKFAANRNILEFHKIARDALYKVRFKRVNYKWYKYDEEYTYYFIYSGSDSDPVR